MIEIMLPTILSEMMKEELRREMQQHPVPSQQRVRIRERFLGELVSSTGGRIAYDQAMFFVQFDSDEELIQFKLTFPQADIHVVRRT